MERKRSAPVKRQRVSRACDQCRAAREKCDGIQPMCFTCVSSNRDCSYTTNPKKRGIQPGYIRTLELALAWVFTNVAGSEAALNTMLTADNSQGSSLLVGKDTADSDKLHKKWRRSTVCKEVERLLRNLKFPTPLKHKPGLPTYRLPVVLSIPVSNLPNPRAFYHLLVIHWAPWPSAGSKNLRKRIVISVLPTNIWRLFDIYFAYTHSWLPISEKHDLLKLSYSYPEDGFEIGPETLGSGEHAELWSVLTLASIQENSTLNESPSQAESPTRSVEDLYKIARNLIPNEDGIFELGHVKALILLALVNLGQDKIEIAWLQIGHASRLLLCLEKRLSSPNTHTSLNSRLKHVFAGCFVLDTIISAQLGLPFYLKGSDMGRRGPVDEEGLDEWHPWVGCEGFGVQTEHFANSTRSPVHSLSVFNQLVKLITIFNASRNSEDTSRAASLEVASQMKDWTAALPRTCSFVRTGTVSVTSTPPILLLRLAYLFAVSVNDSSFYFSETAGMVALPPLVKSFLAIIINHQGFNTLNMNFKTRIRNFKAAYIKAWSPPTSGDHTRSTVLARETSNQPNCQISMSQSSSTANFQLPTPESIHAPFQPAVASRSTRGPDRSKPQPALFPDILPNMSPPNPVHAKGPGFAAPQHQLGNVNSSHFHPVYQEIALDNYNPAATMDLDAFFDEMASLDGAENRENQPQFMQNLGFAPDADLTDVLASDYGQFDPLLSAFLHPNVVGHSSIDQAGSYDGG
ncbi:uncharacterized protein BDZ99DRAFT_511955 [Mytilinidion resinicola]|uniref:Zn(2)-C6 fungal-type domain-containing protein n=1 Tax=Mytilinidion resinicola TaxID=574789 RepID=A0A6A6Y5B6_9PEZI|nr:uncharacterized protein BDZ99DRAFT_511955 [Mytilinidion resinicola]KAF2803850.1 hypothetical protein BDZ99DRAFT_511955 [Mytilinidion resinicola]